MEDSFRVRVDRAFGSFSSSSSSSFSSSSFSSSSSSSSSSSQLLTSSLWSLTDEEIEKRSWTRESDSSPTADDDDDEEDAFPTDVDRLLLAAKGKIVADDDKNPNPNSNPDPNLNPNSMDYRGELEEDIQELDDDDAGEGTSGAGPSTSGQSRQSADDEDDELDVRTSIGMDCTLDFEAEEDEYDKVAVGKEASDDRLYMSDVTDYTPHLNCYNEIPNSFEEISRDPRANHLAAELRLKEDAEAARNFSSMLVSEQTVDLVSDAQNDKEDTQAAASFSSLHVCEQTMAFDTDARNNKEDGDAAERLNSLHVSEQTAAVVADTRTNTSEGGKNLKSILKRKEDQMSDLKCEKRVRFEPNCKSNYEGKSEDARNIVSGTSDGENTSQGVSYQVQDSSLVPDYIRNPSKYTHYTFDSLTDMNEESNRQAFMDFYNIIKKSKHSETEEAPADLSKPVIFNPKKVTSIETVQSKDIDMDVPLPKKSLPISFALENRTEDEASGMEVDNEQEIVAMKTRNGRRAARKYRSKQAMESNGSDS